MVTTWKSEDRYLLKHITKGHTSCNSGFCIGCKSGKRWKEWFFSFGKNIVLFHTACNSVFFPFCLSILLFFEHMKSYISKQIYIGKPHLFSFPNWMHHNLTKESSLFFFYFNSFRLRSTFCSINNINLDTFLIISPQNPWRADTLQQLCSLISITVCRQDFFHDAQYWLNVIFRELYLEFLSLIESSVM